MNKKVKKSLSHLDASSIRGIVGEVIFALSRNEAANTKGGHGDAIDFMEVSLDHHSPCLRARVGRSTAQLREEARFELRSASHRPGRGSLLPFIADDSCR